MKICKPIFVSLAVLAVITLFWWITILIKERTLSSIENEQKNSKCDLCECDQLIETLYVKIISNSKPLSEQPYTRFISCVEKDALQEALALAFSLNAKKKDIESSELVYQLPNNIGQLIIQELYKDDVYITISIVSNCPDLSFCELQYVSHDLYNESDYCCQLDSLNLNSK